MAHAEVVDNQVEFLLDSVVVLELSMHAIALLAQFFYLQLFGTEHVLQLVDLEMQHEFELFKLLDLLFQGHDLLLGLCQCSVSINDLLFLLFDTRLQLNCLDFVVFEVDTLLFQGPNGRVFGHVLVAQIFERKGQI
jgi:hypothetical protein